MSLGWLFDLLGVQILQQPDDTPVPQRRTLKVIGATLTDDPVAGRTILEFASSGVKSTTINIRTGTVSTGSPPPPAFSLDDPGNTDPAMYRVSFYAAALGADPQADTVTMQMYSPLSDDLFPPFGVQLDHSSTEMVVSSGMVLYPYTGDASPAQFRFRIINAPVVPILYQYELLLFVENLGPLTPFFELPS